VDEERAAGWSSARHLGEQAGHQGHDAQQQERREQAQSQWKRSPHPDSARTVLAFGAMTLREVLGKSFDGIGHRHAREACPAEGPGQR
jgi:hypothetical protein